MMAKNLTEIEPSTQERKLEYFEEPGPQPLRFFLYRPRTACPGGPLVVSVHGIARNAAAHAYRLMPEAERIGAVVVAPLFEQKTYGKYQQLLDPRSGIRSDLALLSILDAAHRLSGADAKKVLLFGYSGGAQFTHRFVLAHPHRVRSAVHVAAGWYTAPASDQSYPYGIRLRTRHAGLELNLLRSLEVPQHVMVGELDVERDASLNRSNRVDTLQGRTRLERANNWVRAMTDAASTRPGAFIPKLEILPGVAHSFTDSVEVANLPVRIFRKFENDAGLAPLQNLQGSFK